jgi:hypothetical protein
MNRQLGSARAVEVSAGERAQIRDFANEVLRANAEDGKLDESGQ